MHEARIKWFNLNAEALFFGHTACSIIHTTKYSEGHESCVKMIKMQ